MTTLWEQLGGTANMERIIDEFVDRAIADPAVNYTRDGRFFLDDAAIARSKESALAFFSSATGGPFPYSGPSIGEIHRGMNVTNAEFDAICKDFQIAMENNGVEAAVRGVVMAAVESTRSVIVEAE